MIIDGIEITRALIIDKPWIEYILQRLKPWEMRSGNVKIRGWIGLIEKGSGKIVGVCKIVDCLAPMTLEELEQNFDKHRVDYRNTPEAMKWNTPWVLEDVRRIDPVPYVHKSGAVKWVLV